MSCSCVVHETGTVAHDIAPTVRAPGLKLQIPHLLENRSFTEEMQGAQDSPREGTGDRLTPRLRIENCEALGTGSNDCCCKGGREELAEKKNENVRRRMSSTV